ncbi:MAG TPA: RDD family protein [Candidatus Saccharimonadales bacterium]|nr:RDD family protein [Candidatus Saccharimonadales bacterium]
MAQVNEQQTLTPVIPTTNTIVSSEQQMPLVNQPSSSSQISIPASQPKRYLNFLIDLLFQLVILYFLTFVYIIILHKIPQINFVSFIYYSILNFVIFILYYTLSEGLWGKSPAKFITHTRVIRESGQPLTLYITLLRTLCRCIPFDTFSFLFSKNPQGWHDSLPKTIVIDERNNNPSNRSSLKIAGILIAELLLFQCIITILYMLFIFGFSLIIPKSTLNALSKTHSSPTPVVNKIIKLVPCGMQNGNSFLLEDTAYTLTLKCPENWTISKQFTNSKQATFANPDGNVDFTVQYPIPATSDLNTQISYVKLTQLQNDTIINESNITIHGQTFHTIQYQLPAQNGYVPETLGLATIKNGYYYMFSYNAWTYNYNQYLPDAEIFIHSIVIK